MSVAAQQEARIAELEVQLEAARDAATVAVQRGAELEATLGNLTTSSQALISALKAEIDRLEKLTRWPTKVWVAIMPGVLATPLGVYSEMKRACKAVQGHPEYRTGQCLLGEYVLDVGPVMETL